MISNTLPEIAPLDALRARRTALRHSLKASFALLAQERSANSAAVATAGVPLADWPARSGQLESDVQSLQAALNRLDADVHSAVGKVRLAVAKLEQRRIPLERQLDTLYLDRVNLFAGAPASARAPIPTAFTARLVEIETELAMTTEQLDALDVQIGTASAPLHRHDHDEPRGTIASASAA